MERFKSPSKGNLPDYLSQFQLAPGEVILGVYENNPESQKECIVVTNDSLHLEASGHWREVTYANIVATECPSPQDAKENASVVLKMGDGIVNLPVVGRRGQFFDLFEFYRYLMRVVADQRKPN
jgi:hypothetical protein